MNMRESQKMGGFLLLDKPQGITSHDVVDRLRRITGIQRIGHSGTLDPFATGLLIIGIGREATKRLGELQKLPKTYRATLMLGATSDTGDPTGIIIPNSPALPAGRQFLIPNKKLHSRMPNDEKSIKNWKLEMKNFETRKKMLSKENIENVLKTFTGMQTQVPPMYSAKKVGGKKLYELARAGKTIERAPISISISALHLIRYEWPLLELDIHCSSGTYIRTLGEDIGVALGSSAYVRELTRTAIGPYQLKDVEKLDMITPENWQQMISFVL